MGWILKSLAALLTAPALLAALLGALTAFGASAAALRADGTRFALQLPDGRTLHSHELVGAELRLDGDRRLRIDAVEQQRDLHGKPVWLHVLSMREADGPWHGLCTPHSDGTAHALLVPGREREDGTIGEGDGYVVTCTAGAQAKCVRFGYRPWEPGVRPTYNACIRMVRADYGGEGRPYTENGRLIDMYDGLGVQAPDMAPDQTFEAGWDEHGAVCVHHSRVAANATLDELQSRYPRLRGAIGADCTEALARGRGALMFNRSNKP